MAPQPTTTLPPAARNIELPGYRLLRLIGEGGMAKVYLAERSRDRLTLALKLLDPALPRADAVFLKRFEQECRLIAKIQNEYVARIFDQSFAGESPFIAMEFLPGGDLKARIGAGLGAVAALRIASQIARALDAVHAHGIVHRDLKPRNILFRADGRPAIVDFGLAKNLLQDQALTRYGEVLATPRYMSPEQCAGHPVDPRSDLYSLGVILYEMLTGRRLFDAESPAELVYLHLEAPPPALPARLARLQPILDRLLAKDPERRFQSARELFAAIAV